MNKNSGRGREFTKSFRVTLRPIRVKDGVEDVHVMTARSAAQVRIAMAGKYPEHVVVKVERVQRDGAAAETTDK